MAYAFTGPNRSIRTGLPSSSFAGLVVEEEQIVLSEAVAGIRQNYPGLVIHEILETVMEPADALINAASGAGQHQGRACWCWGAVDAAASAGSFSAQRPTAC